MGPRASPGGACTGATTLDSKAPRRPPRPSRRRRELGPPRKVKAYLFAGLGFGGANVERGDGSHRPYRYFGADAGAGLEFRFWKHIAFSGDVLAFIRDRIGVSGSSPEFVDAATSRYTDSSAGALVRLGGTYDW